MTITKGSTPTPTPSTDSLAAAAQALGQQLAQNQGASGSSGPVFMGLDTQAGGLAGKDTRSLSESAQSQLLRRGQPKWMSLDDATNQYFNWTQKQRDDFRAKGLLSGLLTQGAGDLEAFNLWQNLTKQASMYGAQGAQVGPLDILSGYVKGNSSGGWIKQGNFEVNPLTGEKRYIGPASKTTTQTQVDLTDPATARAIATKQFQDLLGRDPGQGEIAAYAAALTQSETANPSQATTTTQYDPVTGEATNSSTVTQGGLSADAQALLAQDEVKKGKEYGATQAATTYMNALQSAVRGG